MAIEKVEIRLTDVPLYGTDSLLLRGRVQDIRDVRAAAKIMEMRLSEYLRMVVIQTSRQIVALHEAEDDDGQEG